MLKNIGNNSTRESIQIFNSFYMRYSGSDVKGQDVKNMLLSVDVNNKSTEPGSTSQIDNNISIDFEQFKDIIDSKTINDISNMIKNASSYNVSLEYNSDGYVTKIIIKENT